MASPTSQTLAYLRRAGYTADVVERYIAQANIRRDLFGIIDIVAIKAGAPVLGVQTTTLANISARVAKARACPGLPTWLAAGAAFELHGWTLRNGRWRVKVITLRPDDLSPVVTVAPPRSRARKSRWHASDLFQPLEDHPS